MPVLATGPARPALALPEFTDEATLHADSRLHIGVMALWLAHPETAEAVTEAAAIGRSRHPSLRDRVPLTYQAAVYLERLWAPAVALCTGRPYPAPPRLPDLFGQDLGLPPADWLWGKPALLALADRERSNRHTAGDPLAAYEGAMAYLELYWVWGLQRGADRGPNVSGRGAAGHRG